MTTIQDLLNKFQVKLTNKEQKYLKQTMGKEIEDFLREKGFSPVFGEGEIEDIGSLIII